MHFKSVLVTPVLVLMVCLASPVFSTEPTPRPRRVSGLKATTMELKLDEDIRNARRAGRDTTDAEKLKAKGDAELKQGRLQHAKRHYSDAEKALGVAE